MYGHRVCHFRASREGPIMITVIGWSQSVAQGGHLEVAYDLGFLCMDTISLDSHHLVLKSIEMLEISLLSPPLSEKF